MEQRGYEEEDNFNSENDLDEYTLLRAIVSGDVCV
eukprot:SAG11_NODE_15883_length_563_cov_2.398707_2_plen_35_part_00